MNKNKSIDVYRFSLKILNVWVKLCKRISNNNDKSEWRNIAQLSTFSVCMLKKQILQFLN